MITADQLLAHVVGDYLLQSNWMATEKSHQSFAATVHAVCYALPFALLTRSAPALSVIVVTHFAIDRWRLARYVVWAKNWLAPARPASWRECEVTGYPPSVPAWLAGWLYIIADNTLHVLCNALALRSWP